MTTSSPNKKRHRSRPPLLFPTTEIAIIGSGLAALATAKRLEQEGFLRITIYERDSSLNARREGYGLTLKYDPKGILQQLGILEEIALADCPSRSHYLLTSQGHVRGYFGNAFSQSGRGCGQRGNLRVPRQVVRQILLDSLKVTNIAWDHRLVKLEAFRGEDTTTQVKMRLEFSNQETRLVDWVVGADGIRSTVVDCILPSAPRPRSMGVRLILGLTSEQSSFNINHELLRERGFYTLSKGHRLFVMPYSAKSPIRPNEETRYMWQLSFTEIPEEPPSNTRSPEQLLQEALARCHDWHSPVQSMIQSTPLDAIWSTQLCDRDPRQLHDLFLKKIAKQQGTTSSPDFFDRVVFVGDALHAMSCFKGQGANQALLDGVTVAKWFSAALNGACKSPLATLRGCLREVVQRTSPIVAASRQAALDWHAEKALTEVHPFAGVPSDRIDIVILQLYKRKISVDSVPELDSAVQKVLDELGIKEQAITLDPKSNAPQAWADYVFVAIENGDLEKLRQLSWSSNNSTWMKNLSLTSGDTCLHVAARKGNVHIVYWLATQAGCDVRARNSNYQSPLQVASDTAVVSLLESLDR